MSNSEILTYNHITASFEQVRHLSRSITVWNRESYKDIVDQITTGAVPVNKSLITIRFGQILEGSYNGELKALGKLGTYLRKPEVQRVA